MTKQSSPFNAPPVNNKVGRIANPGARHYGRLARMTSPIADITSVPLDPFFLGDSTMDFRESAYPY